MFAAVLAALWAAPAEPLAAGLPYARFGIPLATALVSWRFGWTRVTLAVTALLLADLGYELLPPDSARPLLAVAVALVLPALALGDERGWTGRWGAVRPATVAMATVVVWAAAHARPGDLPPWFQASAAAAPWLAWTPLPLPALGVALASVALFAARSAVRGGAMDRGFLWSVVAAIAALHAAPGSTGASLLFATGSLLLGIAMVEESYTLAYRDGLTGLPSRRALTDALRRLGGRYTVAMVDVDHFKRLNDAHGHDVGDQVLKLVAGRLKRVGGGGRVYRYGGEEFAILFPGASLDEAAPHLEAARANVEAAPFAVRAPDRPRRRPQRPTPRRDPPATVGVTVSIGAAEGTADAQADETIIRADKALYRAKKAGRNRVEARKGGRKARV